MGTERDELPGTDEDGYPIGRSSVYPGEFTNRAKGSPPPSGPGWKKLNTKSENYDTYHRGPPLPSEKKPHAAPPPPPAQGRAPAPPARPPAPVPAPPAKSVPSTSPGTRAAQAVEKNFSGDEDPDGICIPCILRGLAKGALIALVILAILAAVIAALPEAIAAAFATWVSRALMLYFVKGVMDLIHNWGHMTHHARQEAVAEIVGGFLAGLGGGKYMPKPGSLSPKGGAAEVGVTPDGTRVPVPRAEPDVSSGPKAAEPGMEMGRRGNGGGGDEPSPHQPTRPYKNPKSGQSGKEAASDIPSWAKGERPYQGESGKQFAQRLLDEKYGPGNYDARRPGSEFNQLRKYGDRHFE